MGPKSSTDGTRRIEYLPVDDVVETEGNPKDHDLAGVILSICRLGYTSPVVLDERTGRLIAGNGRTIGLRALALYRTQGIGALKTSGVKIARGVWAQADSILADQGRTVPEGITQDADGRWLLPVARGWASADDMAAKAAVIADNKLTMAGGWYEHSLAEWLTDIAQTGGDLLRVTGFDDSDLADITAILGAPDDGKPRMNSRTFSDSSDGDDHGEDGDSGPRDTYEEFGEPDDAAFRPKITITVDNDLFDRWRAILDRYQGDDDAAKLLQLVTDAEAQL